MKFIDKTTKVTLEPKTDFQIEQFRKNPNLEEIKETKGSKRRKRYQRNKRYQ